MVFNATFNNISVISWRSVLLVEETGQKTTDPDKLYQIMLYRVRLALAGFELTTLVVIFSHYEQFKVGKKDLENVLLGQRKSLQIPKG